MPMSNTNRRNGASRGGMLALCSFLLQVNPRPTVGHLLRHHHDHDHDYDGLSEADHFPHGQHGDHHHHHHHHHQHRRASDAGLESDFAEPYHADVFDSCVVPCYGDIIDRYGVEFAEQMRADGFHFEECEEEEGEGAATAAVEDSTTTPRYANGTVVDREQQQRALNRVLGATSQLNSLWSHNNNHLGGSNRGADGRLRIPYKIRDTTEFTHETILTIHRAMNHIETFTGVLDFVHAEESHTEYVYFNYETRYANYCAANLGRRRGAPTNLYLGWCRNERHLGNIIHELIHALGFWHEHSRPDRDEHVQINWASVNPAARNNFAKASMVNSLKSPYDYASIMHYPPTAFSTDRRATIIPVRPLEAWETLGQRAQLSPHDVKQLRLLYQCASGPRDGGVPADELCSTDCPCWEHAMGTCDGDDECMGDLVCATAPKALPAVEHVDKLPVWTQRYGHFSCASYCHSNCCAYANAIVLCPETCDSAPPTRELGRMPERICVEDTGRGGLESVSARTATTEATSTTTSSTTTSTTTTTTTTSSTTTATTTTTEDQFPGAPWYVNWDISRCVQYCIGYAPCGDFGEYDELYPTVEVCCNTRLSYKDFSECHTIPEGQLSQYASTMAPTEATPGDPTEVPTAMPTFVPTESPTEGPTGSPSGSPTKRPSESPVETTTEPPTEGPTGSPSGDPTKPPSESPVETTTTSSTAAAVVVARGGSSLSTNEGSGDWYVDWDITKCVRDCIGDRPCRSRRKESWEPGHSTVQSCCSSISYVPFNECSYEPSSAQLRSGGTQSGNNANNKWYPSTSKCLNDGNAPTWQHKKYTSQSTCCAAHYNWDYDNCMGITPAPSRKWYANWMRGKCVMDCEEGDGGSCGGLVEGNWITTHGSAETCCRENMSYAPFSECKYN